MQDEYSSDTVPMILRRLRPVALVRPIQTHTHFHVAPRLNFTVINQPVQTEILRVERILRNTAGERLVEREELVRRIVDRGARQEDFRRVAPEQAAALTPVMERSGVLAMLLRSAAPVPAVLDVPAPQIGQRAWPAAAPMNAPQPDIARLSEEVIRSIDRRLQAHRERIGRR